MKTNQMKKLLLSLLFITAFANAQPIVNIPDANFKNALLTYIPLIDINNDGEIQVTEAQSVTELLLQMKNISSVEGIAAFTNITNLNLSTNLLNTIDLSALQQLRNVDVNSNRLVTFDVTGNVLLEKLSAQFNLLTTVNFAGCSQLKDVYIGYNQLSGVLDMNNYPLLNILEIQSNQFTDLVLNECHALRFVNIGNNDFFNLNFSNLTQLEVIEFGGIGGGSTLTGTLDVSGCTALQKLEIQLYLMTDLKATGCTALKTLSLVNVDSNDDRLNSMDISGCTDLEDLELNGIGFETFSLAAYPNLTRLKLTACGKLKTLFLKNGFIETNINLQINGATELQYICVDEEEIAAVQEMTSNTFFGNANAVVSSYCSFFPGGDYNTITGKMRFDETNNGCDEADFSLDYMKIKINDGTNEAATFVNGAGEYNFYTTDGNFIVTPQFENPSYFTVSPATATVNFPANDNSVTTQNFCTTANGVHPDLEIVIVPLDFARPGFDSHYQIVYKNKGNQTLSGNISFNFDDAVLDFVSSSPAASAQATGLLTFNYSNLRPFENRLIALTLNANAPTEIPAVNIEDVLVFSAAITPVTADETPDNNVFNFTQTVVGSFDPNDKQCIEGATLETAHIGKYLHYVINFENTGTHVAENVVVKDIINTDQFDMESLQILNASAEMDVKINGNVIEFIFKAIRLPIGGHGNVLFKIKTKNNLPEGTTVTNLAQIFFDYNFPIVTNPAKTQFQTLATTVFDSNQRISIYPNPASNRVQIQSEMELRAVELYDVQGRLLLTKEAQGKQAVIDISAQNAGLYLLKVVSDKGSVLKKIMKK